MTALNLRQASPMTTAGVGSESASSHATGEVTPEAQTADNYTDVARV